ncbi:MAG: hypothetical protein O2992_04775 [Gemmatimonadetes bacterium]|nr:hypothetical protein [Gemmatimonadota bacterium]
MKGQGAEVGGDAREVSYRWALSALTVDGYTDGSGGCADGRVNAQGRQDLAARRRVGESSRLLPQSRAATDANMKSGTDSAYVASNSGV